MSAFSIGKSDRKPTYTKNSNYEAPGVGAYQMRKWGMASNMRNSPSTSMTKAKKFFNSLDKEESQKVGPGTYNPQKIKTKISPTIAGKPKNPHQETIPSPAEYNTIPDIKSPKAHQYSFARSRRKYKTQVREDQVPGPGKYELSKSYVQTISQGPNGSFGHEARDSQLRRQLKNGPGPGAYNFEKGDALSRSQEHTFTKQRKFIAAEAQQRIRGRMPGPGSYNLTQLVRRFKGNQFPHAQRMVHTESDTPSPATYCKISYSSHLIQRKAPQAIIGTEKRMTTETKNATKTPGPGSYNIPKSDTFKKKNGYIIFLQQQRLKNKIPRTPGPGSYQTISYQSPSFSMTPKAHDPPAVQTPGPQSYSPTCSPIHPRSPSPTIGHENRLKDQKSYTPGPGDYQEREKKLGKTCHFGTAKKTSGNGSVNSNVGPGSYKLKPYIGMYDGREKGSKKDVLYV